MFDNDCWKCELIFKILSLFDSFENSLCTNPKQIRKSKKYYRISTFNVNLPQIYNFIHLCVLRIVVVGVVNFPEICQSCYWQWVDCNLLMFCSQWSAHNCCHRHLTSVGLHSTTLFAIYTVFQQEAQLLQRDRARRFLSLNILLSHSRSLKVIRNDTGA